MLLAERRCDLTPPSSQNLPKLNIASANCVGALAVDEWLQTNLLEVGRLHHLHCVLHHLPTGLVNSSPAEWCCVPLGALPVQL